MLGADAGLAARLDLAALGEKAAQARRIFVVDRLHVIHAEAADAAAAIAAALTPAALAATAVRAPALAASAEARGLLAAIACLAGRRGGAWRHRARVGGCYRVVRSLKIVICHAVLS